jgi:putative Mg2+ transporter-C (MgtC) family protein
VPGDRPVNREASITLAELAILQPAWLDGIITTLRLDLLAKLLLAVVLGGMIGLERELSGKAAGLRTNILICVGATVLADLSVRMAAGRVGQPGDPARIAAQVVSGIGFLGAGTILHARGVVKGLTTAATIWVIAAIGLVIGAGFFFEAIGVAVLTTVVLGGLGYIERNVIAERRGLSVKVTMRREVRIDDISNLMREQGFEVRMRKVRNYARLRAAEFRLFGAHDKLPAVEADLAALAGVLSVRIE